MSSSGEISFAWGDGEHAFRLAIGGLRELQDKCNAGPGQIYTRLGDGTWRVDDIRETLRIGLIGGGMKPTDAHVLVTRYVDGRPLAENISPAMAVLGAALIGVPDDKVGETEAGMTQTEADASSSRPITPAAP
ncbi:gene transfer agent family protein [Aquabacter sp. L1I39]|uniref:gene transfer agent family protein n=1 Tax=Aquabacter sp. L1I39 TaxID=2820278 RepID=UPI001ADB4638|nr:gene transfer agent family protein [Aquabacter sp. L1I39]QTL01912.1 gene transfer agent family protein [Aquabacter sp. L1I39]